ncbi:MAG: GNAT family N-acetyltransferase [Clostridia bacterium]|nr:GNAT family N-acetyltransferase [Clostridia bacterium]
MEIFETQLTDELLPKLLAMSADWEAEQSTYGYYQNDRSDIEGNRIFLATENGTVVGYLFGRETRAERSRSIMPDGTLYFEIEELYVPPVYRSRGIGRALFAFAETKIKQDGIEFILLSTATKNYKAILHFYIDEMGMDFWSARLYKQL